MTPLPEKYRTQADWLAAAIAEHNSDDCLLWPFATDRDGYGRVCFYVDGKKDRVFAHRASFRIVHGRWPEPLGLHSCDTPRCFNPRHISEGGHAKNQAEKAERGRSLRGVQQHDATLTDAVVISARSEYAGGMVSFAELGKKYGVTLTAMRWAITGKTWKHIPDAIPTKHKQRSRNCKRGHPLNDDNSYVYNGYRQCKACTALRAKGRVR